MRHLLIAITLLAVGAIASVLSAWLCVIAGTWPAPMEELQQSTVVWPRNVPGHWPKPTQQLRGDRFGIQVIRTVTNIYAFNTDGTLSKSDHFLIDCIDAGWPLRALQWEIWSEFEISKTSAPVDRYEGHPEPTAWLAGLTPPNALASAGDFWKRFPIRPSSWQAFLANTLFFSLVLLALVRGPLLVRRAVRIHLGRCPSCGYPCTHSSVCTECGAPRSSRARRTVA